MSNLSYTDAAMKDDTKHPIGKGTAAARQAAGLSQAQLATHLGVTQQMVGYLERQPVAIRPEVTAQLSEVHKVPLDELLGVKVRAKPVTGPTGRVRQVFEAVSRLPRRSTTEDHRSRRGFCRPERQRLNVALRQFKLQQLSLTVNGPVEA